MYKFLFISQNADSIPAHAAIIAARCQHLRVKIEQAKEKQQAQDETNTQVTTKLMHRRSMTLTVASASAGVTGISCATPLQRALAC